MAAGASRRASYLLVVALLVALAAGAAASLLVGSFYAPSAPPYRASELLVPGWAVEAGIVGFLLFLVGGMVYRRLTSGASPIPGRVALTFLMVILVATLFILAFEFFSGASVSPGGTAQSPTNSTGTPGGGVSNGTNLTHVGNLTAFSVPGLPSWLPFAVVAGVVLVVAAVALPGLRAYVEDRRASRLPRSTFAAEAAAVRTALCTAEAALDAGTDPRAVIVRLYGDLLSRLGRVVGDVGPDTPEEIRTLHLLRLGLRPEAATELTRLFEEARYSSHPLGPDAADRARTSVRAALSDLDRATEAA